MVEVGDKKIGFFYQKNSKTYNEIGKSNFEVVNNEEYARHCSENVVLLLSKENEILDIDDIPTEESIETTGTEFVSFVKSENVYAFVVGSEMYDEMKVDSDAKGLIKSFSIYTEDFELSATVSNGCNLSELAGDTVLLVYTDEVPFVDNEKKTVVLTQANAEIFSIS